MSFQGRELVAGLREEVQHYLPRAPTLIFERKRGLCSVKPALKSWPCCYKTQKCHSNSLDFRFLLCTKEDPIDAHGSEV